MVSVEPKSLMTRLNRFCTRMLEAAAGNCVGRQHYEVTPEHMILQMLEDAGCDLSTILKHYEIDGAKLRKQFNNIVEGFKSGNAGKPTFTPALFDWFQDAWVMSTLDHNLAEIRSGILLRSLLANPLRFTAEDYSELFQGVKRDDLKVNYATIVVKSSEGAATYAKGDAKSSTGGGPGPAGDGSALQKFAINFTERARKNELDPVFGRDREIRQMVDILARRRKNNPICVGEAGVGKTAVVEGLAIRIVEGDVPDVLKEVELIGLDMGLLQAGAGVKGEFENRLKNVINEVKSSPKPIIMFIDEAHTLIGAGGAAGGGDAANLLKPALARGELRTVAATTWSEYKKYFEKDAALARRFQLVKLDEPDDEVATTMLRGLRERYEKSHNVTIRDEALVAAARLGSRYISGRQHPDKGVDLMDTSAARVKIALTSRPDSLQDIDRRIQTLERELGAVKRDQLQGAPGKEPRIAELEAEIRHVKDEQKSLTERWQKEKAAADKVIGIRRQMDELDKPKKEEPKKADEKPAPAAGKDAKGKGKAAPPAETKAVAKAPSKDELKKDLDKALADLKELQGKDALIPLEVDAEVVARVVGDWTGIPIGKMVRDEAATMLKFEESLRKRIKGQDHALETVARGLRAAKAGIKNPRTPMGVFLFVGPSGVGKTEMALGVADTVFGGERFMTTINMSEFQEKHTVSKLVGSPPGYVGYGEGGVLTEAVRQRPYQVVLLDECEKADPEVLNLFYQVFDKGTLADGEGREVDFKDTVIFLTSNLASDIITESAKDEKPPVDELVSQIRPVLSKHFKPALLARMTIVPFYPIGADAMKEITQLKLGSLARRLMESHRMTLDLDPKVIDHIAQRCTEVETGARNVDHILSGTLLPQISTQILQQMSVGPLPDRFGIGVNEAGEFTYAFGNGKK
jgi:type VI secretion system protein VasG